MQLPFITDRVASWFYEWFVMRVHFAAGCAKQCLSLDRQIAANYGYTPSWFWRGYVYLMPFVSSYFVQKLPESFVDEWIGDSDATLPTGWKPYDDPAFLARISVLRAQGMSDFEAKVMAVREFYPKEAG